MNNINGPGGRRSAMASVDFYRRVPKDLTEVSSASICIEKNAAWHYKRISWQCGYLCGLAISTDRLL